jgi:molybdopterin-containing oxidoreductase family iron-sulfur binding subunit
MKRIWNHPEEPKTGKRYWRSTAELEKRSEFLNTLGVEFPAGDTLNEDERENSRREFLKLMGAATGLMGLASCRRPVTKILPYTNHVEWVVPGKPVLYATAMPTANGAVPMVVVNHEGRPTHLQPNPLHPLGRRWDSFAQASILDLYDPERSQSPMMFGKKVSWNDADKAIAVLAAEAQKDGGASLGVVVGEGDSPTLQRLLGELRTAFPQVRLFGYEALGNPAAANLYGPGIKPFLRLSQAHRILSLDCDFLGGDAMAGEPISEFTRQRAHDEPVPDMNRLYSVENRYTLTGGMADHRKALAASLIPAAAAIVAEQVGVQGGNVAQLAASAPASLREWLRPAIADLLDNRGRSVVLVGPRYSAEVQTLVAAINHALGAYGSVVQLLQGTQPLPLGTVADLSAAVAAGTLKTVVSLTPSNLLFDAPGAAALTQALKDKEVKLVHVGLQANVTAKRAALHIPAAHYLESWGDTRAANGVYSIVQPMIQPLYGGFSEIEIVLALLGRKKLAPAEVDPKAPAAPVEDAAYVAVRDTFAAVAGSMDEVRWNHTLRDGFLKDSGFAAAGAPTVAAIPAINPPAAAEGTTEVVLVPSANLYDGRYANNAWLQETPDPVTKLTWDNAAWIGSRTFRDLKLKTGQMVRVTVNNVSVTLPAIEAPGHVGNSITIPLGYGQTGLGYVGSGDRGRGFDAYPLRQAQGDFVITGAKVEPLSEIYELAITQDQNTMEGRAVFREGTLETFKNDKKFADNTGMDGHIPPNISLYNGLVGVRSESNKEGFDYEHHHQWGMVIDLSKCIGCTACVVACQSENNIPVVGKDQVRKGRLMQWIRMDRYFATARTGEENAKSDDVDRDPTPEQLENAEMVQQFVACQHCEAAPCETVCPVNATVHTSDGLNAMAYNRCIGTRYCANNCPYTARRFNFFDYNKRPLDELYLGPLSTAEKTGVHESLQLQKNPNVTVRMRGVIEKCTFCVQRLESAKIQQKQQQRDSKNFRIPADAVKTACQASCSADAIVFGDIANPESSVVKAKESNRNYVLLKYLGTRPRTSYLARLKNPNPSMPGFDQIAAWSAHQN